MRNVEACLEIADDDVAALGITNQRETTVVWDRETGRADPQRDRLAGHPHGRDGARARRPRPAARQHRPAAVDLLQRPEDRVDPRPRRRRPRARRGRRAAVRDDGHVGAVEPHRRPRDRRHQREPHVADGPRDARLERRELRAAARAGGDAARDPLELGGLRRVEGDSGRGHPRRPAGGALRADRLRARRRQEHVRDGVVLARQHRRGAGADRPAADHGGLQARGGAGALRARGLDRGHRRAHPVAARPAVHHRLRRRDRGARAQRRRQRRRLLRPRLLRVCSPRTGATTPAARSSA